MADDPFDVIGQLISGIIGIMSYGLAKKQYDVQKVETILEDLEQEYGYTNQNLAYSNQILSSDNSQLSDANSILSNDEELPEQKIQKAFNLYSYYMNNANQYRQSLSRAGFYDAAINNLQRWNKSYDMERIENNKINHFYQGLAENIQARNKLVRDMVNNSKQQNINVETEQANTSKEIGAVAKAENEEKKIFKGSSGSGGIKWAHL